MSYTTPSYRVFIRALKVVTQESFAPEVDYEYTQQTIKGTPYYDITDRVESLRFEDCLREDDIVEIQLTSSKNFSFDEVLFVEGDELLFSYGYNGGRYSKKRFAIITDVDVSYAETISVKITGFDVGNEMRKTSSLKIWKNASLKSIATTIAQRHGLTVPQTTLGYLESVTELPKSLPQAGLSDFTFLNKLSKKIGNGYFVFYIKDRQLRLEPMNLFGKPVKTFTYALQDEVISFDPKLYRAQAEAEEQSVGTDEKAEPVGRINERFIARDANTVKVGEYERGKDNKLVKVYDGNGKVVGSDSTAIKIQELNSKNSPPNWATKPNITVQKKIVANPEAIGNSAEDLALGIETKLRVDTATLTIVGNPLLQVNTVIQIKNVYKIHGGNWLIDKITHDISTGGYITTIELVRETFRKPELVDDVDQERLLTTEEKQLYVQYNADGTRVGEIALTPKEYSDTTTNRLYDQNQPNLKEFLNKIN